MVGQDILDLVNDRLGGYQNAIDPETAMRFINDAKDEVWAILKNLEDDYFGKQTQSTDSTGDAYFPPLVSTQRQYTLPPDLKEIRYIECITPGFEQLVFVYKALSDPDYRAARRSANIDRTLTPTVEYFFTIQGKDQFILAQFPEQSQLIITIFYNSTVPDFELSDDIDDLIVPFTKKMADFAAKKITLSLQDQQLSQGWVSEWRESVQTIAATASPRNQSDPTYVQDFLA